MDLSVEIPQVIDFNVVLPASKSITARALIITALATGDQDIACDHACCDDTAIMAKALSSHDNFINVEGAGTAMRFLTAFFACQQGRTVTLDGDNRMRLRPIGPLVDALRLLGASIDYLGQEGCPPLMITGRQLHGGNITMRGDVSSQFISALLMIAPLAGGITLTIEGDIVSRPYIDMTMALMRQHGINVQQSAEPQVAITVPAGCYAITPLDIEGDWSAASYWFALKALLPQSRITLSPLHAGSLQGDSAIVDMMKPLGVAARFENSNTVFLISDKSPHFPTYYERNMSATPDLVPTLAVTLCLLRVPFSLSGVHNLRIKESDRLEALRLELTKLGYSVVTGDDSLSYDGNHSLPAHKIEIDPHGDHRIAMAMSLAATRHRGITIKNAQVVSKSYPTWWQELTNDKT